MIKNVTTPAVTTTLAARYTAGVDTTLTVEDAEGLQDSGIIRLTSPGRAYIAVLKYSEKYGNTLAISEIVETNDPRARTAVYMCGAEVLQIICSGVSTGGGGEQSAGSGECWETADGYTFRCVSNPELPEKDFGGFRDWAIESYNSGKYLTLKYNDRGYVLITVFYDTCDFISTDTMDGIPYISHGIRLINGIFATFEGYKPENWANRVPVIADWSMDDYHYPSVQAMVNYVAEHGGGGGGGEMYLTTMEFSSDFSPSDRFYLQFISAKQHLETEGVYEILKDYMVSCLGTDGGSIYAPVSGSFTSMNFGGMHTVEYANLSRNAGYVADIAMKISYLHIEGGGASVDNETVTYSYMDIIPPISLSSVKIA